MKNKFKLLSAVAAFGLLATACSNSNEETPASGGNKGEKGFVQLTITSEIPASRGSSGEQAATTEESKIDAAKGLKVYVFNEDGSLDYASTSNLVLTETGANTNIFTSSAFEVAAGNKFFFVFANDAQSGGKIAAPTSNMEVFMKKAVATVNAGGALDITTDNSFLLGTLWQEVKLAEAGGTAAAPKHVNLKIGRLGSKVNLKAINYVKHADSDLQGAFQNSDRVYRIGSMPHNINTVGVHEGLNIPAGNPAVLVTSYVHNSVAYIGTPPTATFNSTDFIQYAAAWKTAVDQPYYTTENTTGRDAVTGQQYYGNTTYVQIETLYKPVAAELHDPATLIAGEAVAADGTFYSAMIKSSSTLTSIAGKRVLFTANPTEGTPHADIDQTTVLKYTEGKNYHKFPVFDTNESDDVNRNRVLRNHYYEFDVTSFKDLGSHVETVDPWEPIPTKTTVDVQVEVKGWDKVSGSIGL